MENRLLAAAALIVIMFVGGCGQGSGGSGSLDAANIESLYVSPNTAELALGSEYQFYAIAVDKSGNPQKVKADWSIYTAVGSVDTEGKYLASTVSGGDYVIAEYAGKTAYAYVSVKPGALAAMTIDPTGVTLEVGGSVSLTASGQDIYGNSVSVSPTWRVESGIGSISEDYYSYYYSAQAKGPKGFSANDKGIKCSSAFSSNYVYFTAGAGGDGKIVATYGSFEVSVPVKVIAAAPYSCSTHWLTKAGETAATPRGVAVGPDGNIWVAMYVYDYTSTEAYQGHVFKYDCSGTLLASLESTVTGEGRLQVPNDLAFDSGGNLYLVDYYANKVRKYDSSGNFLLAWGGSGSAAGKFSYPARIAIDPSDNVYVTDSGNNRVQKFNSSGVFQQEWGSYGSGTGQFSTPAGIVIDSAGNIFVADKGNNRVQKFSSSGSWLATIGSSGSGVGELSKPIGLALDSSGNLFVADGGNYRLCVYDSPGNYLYKWGSYGSSTNHFYGLIDVAVDSSQNVYTAEQYNTRIQKFVK